MLKACFCGTIATLNPTGTMSTLSQDCETWLISVRNQYLLAAGTRLRIHVDIFQVHGYVMF